MWIDEIKPTANRRESRPSGSQNRICLSSLSQVSRKAKPCSAEAAPTGQPALDLLVPSSGTFGQILSPPQRLLWEKKVFLLYFGVRGRDCGPSL